MQNTRDNLFYLGMTMLFAILMSLPFLVPHLGFVALVGFLPLLIMDRVATLSGKKHFWIWHYLSFVLWNAITTFWVCNATVGGGLFAIFANAFQMSLIFGIFRFSKRHFSGVLPYFFLVMMWIAWERAYFDADISWPWLVLGNAFATSTKAVQWYEITGALGGSLWIWASNLSIFGIMVALSDGRWFGSMNLKARISAVSGTVIVIFAPFIISHIIYVGYEEKGEPLEFLIVQPNIDPYNKFEALTQRQQNDILLDLTKEALQDRFRPSATRTAEADSLTISGNEASMAEASATPLIVLAPETFTNDVITNDLSASRTLRTFDAFLQDYPGVNILFGASSYTYIDSPVKPSHTARRLSSGRWLESHNSALITDGKDAEIFHKSKLVVAVEKLPYPAIFSKIDDTLGGVMGRCVGQDSISLLHYKGIDGTVIPIGCAVCYESVYGEYYTGYVRAGAPIMTVITNDAWWGNTPGYRQHLRYASLRAIETRRSIARCGNTGISAFIDQRGNIVEASSWWEPQTLRRSAQMNDEITFFVENGDVTGRVCTFLFWILAAFLLVRTMIRRKS